MTRVSAASCAHACQKDGTPLRTAEFDCSPVHRSDLRLLRHLDHPFGAHAVGVPVDSDTTRNARQRRQYLQALTGPIFFSTCLPPLGSSPTHRKKQPPFRSSHLREVDVKNQQPTLLKRNQRMREEEAHIVRNSGAPHLCTRFSNDSAELHLFLPTDSFPRSYTATRKV